jgi:hypothetical protein
MGAFADAVWSNKKWNKDFVWVRQNRTVIPLTKPMSIVEHGKHISKSIRRWTDKHQSVYETVIQPLVDYELSDEKGPDSAFSERPMNSLAY